MNKNTLYITFDGLSDPLGQSQILPYLCGLSGNGYQITILSCEKKERLALEKSNIESSLKGLNIDWQFILYDHEGGFLSRLNYVRQIKALAKKNHLSKSFSLIHCRSYLASLIGLYFKLHHRVPFLFDMRGFWADERIDGGIWKKSNPIQLLLYTYFKRKEKQFLKHSDAVVSLTQAGLNELHHLHSEIQLPSKTSIIPCCTNTQLFNNTLTTTISLPAISNEDFVLIYTGSIGTWYYTREIIDCALAWKSHQPNLKLLILTKDRTELDAILKQYHPKQLAMIVTASCSYRDVSSYLTLANAAIFFIKPAYSKIASSPTKMAECWAMDLPIITNVGIGDNDLYFNKHHGGILISDFTKKDYEQAFMAFQQLPHKQGTYRNLALTYFDNTMAIEKYSQIYQKYCKA